MRRFTFMLRRRRWMGAALGLFLLASHAAADLLTPEEHSFSLFYLVPIALLARYPAGAWPWAAAAAGALLWSATHLARGDMAYFQSLEAWWAVAVRLGTYAAFIMALGRIRRQFAQARAAHRQLSEIEWRFRRTYEHASSAEEALRESEQGYREIFEASSDGIFVVEVTEDQRFRLLSCNPAQERMMDLPASRMVGRFPEDYLPRELARQAIRDNLQCIQLGVPMRFEREFDSPRGRQFHVTTLVPVRNPAGRTVRLIGVTRDDTQRNHADERLRTLSSAVEQSPALIVITDTAGDIEYVNPRFTEVTGYLPEEVRGKNSRMFTAGDTPLEDYVRLWDSITAGKVWRGEFRNRKKNGEVYQERASISPIVSAGGLITHFVAVKEDITERQRLEDKLRQVEKLESIGRLAGGVAHDFNNILAVILGNVGLLREGTASPEENAESLSQVERAANRGASLTRQLLLFSRRQAMNARPVDLNDVVSSMTRMLRRLIGEDIDLVLQGTGASHWVKADPGMLDQVLMNLCINARDAMPRGGRLTIGVQKVELDDAAVQSNPEALPGQFVRLSVSDTGVGMDALTASRVFEPFFTTKPPGKGTGLGLANVYGIIKEHGGWIQLASAPGSGATFDVYLPALSETVGFRQAVDAAAAPGGSETILMAEDDPELHRLAGNWLRKLGYTVLGASNATEALDLWAQRGKDVRLLLTDMVMPGGTSGLDLALRLRGERPDLGAIITSGYDPEKSRSDQLLENGIDYLPKPYSGAELARAVRARLDKVEEPAGDR